MPLILQEDEGKKLSGKKAIVPKRLSDELKKRKSAYSDYTMSRGWKRLNALTGDYNKRSDEPNMTSDGRKIVSFSDLKKIDYEMRHMDQSKKNLEYQMLGSDTKQWVHDELNKIRTANKKVNQVKPVPKLEKPKELDSKDNNVKVGKATFNVSENNKKSIIIPESKILKILEDRNQTMFNFDNNGNVFYGKYNYQHFIDYLENIGKYGQLSPTNFDSSFLMKYVNSFIDDALENTLTNNVDDDDVFDNLLEGFAEILSDAIEGDNRAKGFLTDNGFELAKMLSNEKYISKIGIFNYLKNNIYQPLKFFLNDNGLAEIEDYADEINLNRLEESNFFDGLTLNDRGLLYIERCISIPYTKGYRGNDRTNDTFKYFSNEYGGVGNCWSWKKGGGEAYLSRSFDDGTSIIRMIGCVDPRNVDWVTTISRNMYSLRNEKEIYIDNFKTLEIDEISIENENKTDYQGNNYGTKLLKNPIIVRA